MNADDILTPHSPEVVAAIIQKRLDEFDAMCPGIIQKTKEWMIAEEFGCLRGPRKVYCTYAPLIVINKIVGFTGIMEWFIGTEEDDMLVDVANLLWRDYVKC